jgi:hypothetical protein
VITKGLAEQIMTYGLEGAGRRQAVGDTGPEGDSSPWDSGKK